MISYRRIAIFLLIVFLLILDQSIKMAMDSYLILHHPFYVLPFFSLYLTYNTGVAFSILANTSPWLIISMRILIVSAVILIWKKAKNSYILDAGYMLIIAGALGNLIDNYLYGYVIDYVMLHIRIWSFAIFNFADFFITLGACMLIYNEIILLYKEKKSSF
ncbi:signal peptidase II [Liberibacter sp. Z1]|nr:signal peptidase II [Candidatus Liberibacter sp.]